MFKAVLGLFIWAGVLFAGHPEQPPLPPPPHFEEQVMPNPPPPRKDLMNPFSPVTQMKLQRGERILSTFVIFKQKLQEREADMFGLYLYKKSGYSISFFPYTLRILSINPNIHYGSSKIFAKECSSLSMKDPHFSMKERFHLLVSESQRF